MVIDTINEFARQNPSVKLSFHSPNLQDGKNKLVMNKFDILITKEDEVEHLSSCDWVSVVPTRTVAYISESNPIFKERQNITFADLKECQFVTTSPVVSNRIHNNLYTACQLYGFVPKNVKYVNHIAEMHMEVHINSCVGILDERECSHIKGVRLLPLERMPVKSIVFAWNRINNNPMLKRFITFFTTYKDNALDN